MSDLPRAASSRPAPSKQNTPSNQNGQTPQPSGLAPRKSALIALEACFFHGKPLDDAFELQRAKLSASDAGLAWAICQEVARERLRLKVLKQAFLKRPLPKNAAAAGLILDIALVQLLKMEGAPHAVISTAVDLAKQDKRPAVRTLSKLINGVLRNVQRKRDSGALYLPPPIKALPQWLQSRWQTQFGRNGAAQLAECALTPPALHLSLKSQDDIDVIAQQPGVKALGARRIGKTLQCAPGTSPASVPGFSEGAMWVQDRSASLPALILAPEPGAFCYDLCAAPGGKTLQLAAMGADVMAIDIADDRLDRLRDNLKRTGLDAEIEVADLTDWAAPAPAAFILLDAPCTALGTFQRHPDVLHQRRQADVAGSAARQSQLLDAAWKALAPGGVLVYAVCSLELEEGPEQIAAFLARTSDATITPVEPSPYDLPQGCALEDGTLRLAPHILRESGGGDGFFIAKLTRNA